MQSCYGKLIFSYLYLQSTERMDETQDVSSVGSVTSSRSSKYKQVLTTNKYQGDVHIV